MERRKLYLHDPTLPIPKTTAWRLRKRNPDVVLPTVDYNSKRRKAYYRDSACPVPRSTLWKWNNTGLDCEDDVRDAEHNEGDELDEELGRSSNGSRVDKNGDENSGSGGYGENGDENSGSGNESSVCSNGDDCSSDERSGESIPIEGVRGDNTGDDDNRSTSESNGSEVGSGDEGSGDEGSCILDGNGENNRCDESGGCCSDGPLYQNSPVSVETSMYSTYLYVVKNKLSYQATSQLLDLLRIHLPSPNHYPESLHVLKKYLSAMASLKITKFCSVCFKEVPQQHKHCSNSHHNASAVAHFALLPFEDHIRDTFSGTNDMHVLL